MAHLVDLLVMLVLLGFSWAFFGVLWEGVLEGSDIVPREFVSLFGSGGMADDNMVGFFARLTFTMLLWLYYALMESSRYQATLGKLALGLAVTDLHCRRVSFGKATGRHFGKYVSVVTVGIGILMIAFTKRKQGLHDIISGCLVVRRSCLSGQVAASDSPATGSVRPHQEGPGSKPRPAFTTQTRSLGLRTITLLVLAAIAIGFGSLLLADGLTDATDRHPGVKRHVDSKECIIASGFLVVGIGLGASGFTTLAWFRDGRKFLRGLGLAAVCALALTVGFKVLGVKLKRPHWFTTNIDVITAGGDAKIRSRALAESLSEMLWREDQQ